MANHHSKGSFHLEVLKRHAGMLDGTERFHLLLTNLRYEGKPRLGSNIFQAEKILGFLNEVILQFQIEEKFFFPFLLGHIPKLKPTVRLLKAEHGEFEIRLKKFQQDFRRFADEGRLNAGFAFHELWEDGMYLIYLLRHHIRAEGLICKIMTAHLRADERAELKPVEGARP